MGDIVFNIAKGRTAEYCQRVDANDPAGSVLVVVLLASTGLEADAVLIDKDTLADVLAGTTNEATNTGYSRIELDDTEIGPFAPTDASDRFDCDIPDQTWAGVANDGTGAIGAFLVCYDPTSGAGTDADVVPLTKHDFAVTPDGSNITAQIAAAGFYRAS